MATTTFSIKSKANVVESWKLLSLWKMYDERERDIIKFKLYIKICLAF